VHEILVIGSKVDRRSEEVTCMKTVKRLVCSFCDNDLTDEEMESPRHDPDDGKPVCDECYTDHFEFNCCACEEYGDVEDQHKYIVVFETVDDVEPGFYRVKSTPYYTSGLIGSSWLHPWALVLVKPLPVRWLAYVSITGKEIYQELKADDLPDGFPCGHLCANCQKAALASVLSCPSE
jgi:hypothetical protein